MLSHTLVAVAHGMHTSALLPDGVKGLSITVQTLGLLAPLTQAKRYLGCH